MKSVIAKLNASFPGDYNPASKAAVLDAGNRVVATSHADSAFSLIKSAESVKALFQDDWQAGDVAILNDPNQGATHVCQLTAVAPHFADGAISGWAVVRANVPDLGGWLIGGYSPEAVDRWAEAARFVPAKVLLSGRERREVLDLLSLNSRTPNVTRRCALAIANTALELKPDGHADEYPQLYAAESALLLERIRPLAGKRAESASEVKTPAGWPSPGIVKAALEFTDRGIQVSLTAPSRSGRPLNLAEYTTQDIVLSGIAAALGHDGGRTDALAALTAVRIAGDLLAAPEEACVGIGRETSGAAIFQALLDAARQAGLSDEPSRSAVESWLSRETIAALDWETGALVHSSADRFLSIESEIAR